VEWEGLVIMEPYEIQAWGIYLKSIGIDVLMYIECSECDGGSSFPATYKQVEDYQNGVSPYLVFPDYTSVMLGALVSGVCRDCLSTKVSSN
jgi:hypothetical protein